MGAINHRLRGAMTAVEMTTAGLASRVGVDAKSVERWVTQGRCPRPTARARVAQVLGQDETYFWPELVTDAVTVGSSSAEVAQVWPSRDAVPVQVWRQLVDQTHRELRVLVYSGGFLVETAGLVEAAARIAGAGGTVRILLGDPASETVKQRGVDEGLPSLPARCASTAEYLSPVAGLPGVQLRTHSTPLYASLLGADDQWMVNPHTHGVPAMSSPVLRLVKVPGGRLVDYYQAAFERVWATATSARHRD